MKNFGLKVIALLVVAMMLGIGAVGVSANSYDAESSVSFDPDDLKVEVDTDYETTWVSIPDGDDIIIGVGDINNPEIETTDTIIIPDDGVFETMDPAEEPDSDDEAESEESKGFIEMIIDFIISIIESIIDFFTPDAPVEQA